jgi:hypothetical protein
MAVDCPGNCTGHGTCSNSTCLCDAGFSGPDCAVAGCINNCTMHGTCTSNGTCACDPGHFGLDCSLTDLRCGSVGNCSGHGSCVDPGNGQWWSGAERDPDLWEDDAGSRHWARSDTQQCLVDWYGLPSELLTQPTTWTEAGNIRMMRSGGVPDHIIVTAERFPVCNTQWAVSLPREPSRALQPTPLPVGAAIAIAINGIPVWGAELSDGSNAVEGDARVPCYGHSSTSGMWHYHHPLFGCHATANEETLLGYALDGFPIYGPFDGSKDDVDKILDECNGRLLSDKTYRYHVRTLDQVDELAQPRRAGAAATRWNYVLGCFSGTPIASLGMRLLEARKPVAGQQQGTQQSVAQQLGLTSRVGVCLCDPGWVGPDCDVPGCASNCSGHGACVRRSANLSSCVCDATWMGNDCSQRFNGTCGAGCSGHGTCLFPHTTNATCMCDPLWTGSDCSRSRTGICLQNCSSRGSCFNGTCLCDAGYSGAACQSTTADMMNINATLCWQWINGRLTNNSCSGRGTCHNGTCMCDPGWHGVNCSTPAPSAPPVLIDCLNNCSFHGACTFLWDALHGTYNGTCVCDVGWEGPDCSLDWSKSVCTANCSEHGTCVNGTCACDPGWTGDDCTVTWASLVRLCPLNCSDHGSCSNGTCTCDAGWLGDNCSMSMPCPGDCSGHGACVLGNCTCDPGFAGADCSHSNICPGFVPLLGVNCSGHGVCIGGNCSCDEGWGGMDCSERGCLRSCSGHGVCVNGTCACMTGFIGADCSQGPYGGECPGMCTGHGACSIVESSPVPIRVADFDSDGFLSANIGCVCDEGWDGPDCSLRACPKDCSGNGACAQNGTCICYKTWGGPDCGEARCPEDCNGRGTCVGGVGCLCDIGYAGEDCSQAACANNCSMNGICVAGPGVEMGDNLGERGYDYRVNNSFAVCQCFYGWGGDDCSQIACPMNCSFPQGTCLNGTCVCDKANGYFGRNCSERFGTVSLRTDGQALSPSFGIFTGGSLITIRGTGFVDSDTMRCKFGDLPSTATIVQPTPPERPFAVCRTPAALSPRTVLFQFSLDGTYFTEPDPRIVFAYHGSGVLNSVRWPTAPAQGGTTVIFDGINFQFASAVQCKFGELVVNGEFTVSKRVYLLESLRCKLVLCVFWPED